ncbi:MAG: PaaI family thioesterase [Burkholderiaceae bacterium]
MDPNAFFWQIREGLLPPLRAVQTLGMRILRVDAEAGVLEAEFDGKEDFTNPAGNIQGGFLTAMLDDAIGPALAAQLAAGEFAPTLNLNVQFLTPAQPGKLQGTGRVVKRGGAICFLAAELHQQGTLVATATATAAIRRLP